MEFMEPSHLFLLLVITGALVCAIAGVLALLWRGYQAALRNNAGHPIQWNEASHLLREQSGILKQKGLQLLSTAFAGKFWPKASASGSLAISDYVIADPVDGTAFQEGETIVQCACGTNYHQQSWQWIITKNAGQCVNCKRPRQAAPLALQRFGASG